MLYRKAKSIDQYKQKVFLRGDVLILDGKRYSGDDLGDLPADLSPRLFSEKQMTSAMCLVGSIVSLICLVTGIRAGFNTVKKCIQVD